ncbi:glycosyltransferase family protein [Azospirillum agricola]|uniref:glycosyltransferase family protein n=1 Tax=Azospirillum agricola TaxID=1720247 RepID=UPI000A0EF3FE|nr:glycosyltransferase [Azospirillum agricola]SMH41532.1 hypothetical protein SAMN02982994_1737 [Azospirillum lipoferum]
MSGTDSSKGGRRTLVVFYNARYSLPLRSSNEAHLFSWKRYSRHHVLYVNVGFGVPWRLLERLDIDAIIFDTIFLTMHWDPALFEWRAGPCRRLRSFDCPKIAVVQDEFMHMHLVVPFLRDVGATHVLTCADPPDWAALYGTLDQSRTSLRTALTGYVDERRLAWLRDVPRPLRDIDIGYRAWRNPYWLGEHGQQKVLVGQKVGEAARRRGFTVDINSLDAHDFLIGDRWFEFLLRCRGVLGVEGGASVLDWDGSVRERVADYLERHPGATFEETRAACFPDRDHTIGLACLSPRHFEAAMTGTCQILLEGRYNGVFEPWRHYIPVRPDYSNLDEALEAFSDHGLTEQISRRCREEIVESGRWSYRSFVQDIEETIVEAPPVVARRLPFVQDLCRQLLHWREQVVWRFANFEARTKPGSSFAVRYLLAEGRNLLDLN